MEQPTSTRTSKIIPLIIATDREASQRFQTDFLSAKERERYTRIAEGGEPGADIKGPLTLSMAGFRIAFAIAAVRTGTLPHDLASIVKVVREPPSPTRLVDTAIAQTRRALIAQGFYTEENAPGADDSIWRREGRPHKMAREALHFLVEALVGASVMEVGNVAAETVPEGQTEIVGYRSVVSANPDNLLEKIIASPADKIGSSPEAILAQLRNFRDVPAHNLGQAVLAFNQVIDTGNVNVNSELIALAQFVAQTYSAPA